MQSIAYIGAMSLGAAVYDPTLMQPVVNALGINVQLTQDITLRFPLYLTLIFAIMTLSTTLRMQDQALSETECKQSEQCSKSMFQAFTLTLKAGHWILKTPFALVIILAGLMFDNCIRMVLTLGSQYYRLISLPEASFGLIGSGLAVLGLIIPRLAHKMVNRHSPTYNLAAMAILTLLGLIGMTFFLPVTGLLPVALLSAVMYLDRFFQSHYLNRITASHQRATVLSFRGLSFNLAYGLIGVLYSILLAFLRPQVSARIPSLDRTNLENTVFIESMGWFPWYFLLTLAAMLAVARLQLKDTNIHKMAG
jgi:hypothetical protein